MLTLRLNLLFAAVSVAAVLAPSAPVSLHVVPLPVKSPRLLGMSTRGDRDLRKLLVHGARATRRWAVLKHDPRSQWVRALIARRGNNRAAVA